MIFAILGGLVLTLVPNQYLCDIFLDLMMYGRNAPPEEVIDKVIAMFTARVGASLFWNDPIAFLINHPLGIGLEMALSMTYEVPGKNIILGNHSLILILLDAYGLLFLVIAALALCYLFYKRSRQAGLGLVMLGLPMLITNEPHIAYAIPLMILMSHKSIVSFNSNRLPLKSLATHDTA